jgi:hypothetical protein
MDRSAAGARKVLIVDFAVSGGTMAFFRDALEAWRSARGHGFQVDSLALVDILGNFNELPSLGFFSRFRRLAINDRQTGWGLEIMASHPFVFDQMYRNKFYEHVSAYGPFNLAMAAPVEHPRDVRPEFMVYFENRARLEGRRHSVCGFFF